MENGLTKDETEELRELFNFYDKPGSGNIPTKDIRNMLKGSRFAAEGRELKRLLADIDPASRGSATFAQLLAGLQKRTSPQFREVDPREELFEAFRFFDRTNSGFVRADDLIEVLARLRSELDVNESEIGQLVRDADFDKDGRIDYQEFVRMLFEVEQMS